MPSLSAAPGFSALYFFGPGPSVRCLDRFSHNLRRWQVVLHGFMMDHLDVNNITTMKPVAKFLRLLVVQRLVFMWRGTFKHPFTPWTLRNSPPSPWCKTKNITNIDDSVSLRSLPQRPINSQKSNLTKLSKFQEQKTHLFLPWMNWKQPPHHHCYTRVALFTTHWWSTNRGIQQIRDLQPANQGELYSILSLNDGIFKITKCPSRCFICNMAFGWWSCPKVRLAHYCAASRRE